VVDPYDVELLPVCALIGSSLTVKMKLYLEVKEFLFVSVRLTETMYNPMSLLVKPLNMNVLPCKVTIFFLTVIGRILNDIVYESPSGSMITGRV
jgi:hypothetical protein